MWCGHRRSAAGVERSRDFFGRTVIIAARVADAAKGGEILVTEEVRAAAPDVVEYEAPRDVALKGLSGTQRVASALWHA